MINIVGDTSIVLLLHGKDLTDSSTNKKALTNQGATVSTAQSKFGGSSLYFNGSSRILVPDIVLGDSDFTIDWWEYPTSSSCGARFCSEYATVTSEMGGMLLGYSGKYLYASSASNSNWDMVNGATAFSVTVNAWTHWAVVRKGNKLSTYRNGVLFWSQTISGAVYRSGKYMAAVGDYRAGDHSQFVGYIDEFCISNVAKWTGNFTPPTEPYISGNIVITEGGIIPKKWALRRRFAKIEPAAPTHANIQLTGVFTAGNGSGENNGSYSTVTINGVVYNKSQTVTVPIGTVITLFVSRDGWQNDYNPLQIIINGAVVVSHPTNSISYQYTVTGDCVIESYAINEYRLRMKLTSV